MQPTSRFYLSDGLISVLMDANAPPGPPETVLFLHGACLNGAMWNTAIARFGRRYRCLAPDLPGHGANRQGPFRLEAALDELEHALRDTPRLSIVGESLGGYVGMALAARLGARVRCTLVSGASANLRGPYLLPWLVQSSAHRLMGRLLGPQRLQRAVETKVRDAVPAALAEAVIARGLELDAFEEAVSALRGNDFRAIAAQVQAPMLFLNGARDMRCCLQESSFVASACNASAERVPGAVHGVGLWLSQQFARIAQGFVDRHAAA